jgi:hypothetical protein
MSEEVQDWKFLAMISVDYRESFSVFGFPNCPSSSCVEATVGERYYIIIIMRSSSCF